MSLLLTDIVYLGIKTCFYATKIIGIASYNCVAYLNGYEMLHFFPTDPQQLLLDEIRELKEELREIKISIQSTPFGFEEVLIEEVSTPKLLEYK